MLSLCRTNIADRDCLSISNSSIFGKTMKIHRLVAIVEIGCCSPIDSVQMSGSLAVASQASTSSVRRGKTPASLQMSVRASLSAANAPAILRYLAP